MTVLTRINAKDSRFENLCWGRVSLVWENLRRRIRHQARREVKGGDGRGRVNWQLYRRHSAMPEEGKSLSGSMSGAGRHQIEVHRGRPKDEVNKTR